LRDKVKRIVRDKVVSDLDSHVDRIQFDKVHRVGKVNCSCAPDGGGLRDKVHGIIMYITDKVVSDIVEVDRVQFNRVHRVGNRVFVTTILITVTLLQNPLCNTAQNGPA